MVGVARVGPTVPVNRQFEPVYDYTPRACTRTRHRYRSTSSAMRRSRTSARSAARGTDRCVRLRLVSEPAAVGGDPGHAAGAWRVPRRALPRTGLRWGGDGALPGRGGGRRAGLHRRLRGVGALFGDSAGDIWSYPVAAFAVATSLAAASSSATPPAAGAGRLVGVTTLGTAITHGMGVAFVFRFLPVLRQGLARRRDARRVRLGDRRRLDERLRLVVLSGRTGRSPARRRSHSRSEADRARGTRRSLHSRSPGPIYRRSGRGRPLGPNTSI